MIFLLTNQVGECDFNQLKENIYSSDDSIPHVSLHIKVENFLSHNLSQCSLNLKDRKSHASVNALWEATLIVR